MVAVKDWCTDAAFTDFWIDSLIRSDDAYITTGDYLLWFYFARARLILCERLEYGPWLYCRQVPCSGGMTP